MRDVTPVTHTHTDRRTVELSAESAISCNRSCAVKLTAIHSAGRLRMIQFWSSWGLIFMFGGPCPHHPPEPPFLPSFAEKLQKRSTSPWSGRRARTSFAFLCGGRVEGAVNANLIIMASSSSSSPSSSSLPPPLSSIS